MSLNPGCQPPVIRGNGRKKPGETAAQRKRTAVTH